MNTGRWLGTAALSSGVRATFRVSWLCISLYNSAKMVDRYCIKVTNTIDSKQFIDKTVQVVSEFFLQGPNVFLSLNRM